MNVNRKDVTQQIQINLLFFRVESQNVLMDVMEQEGIKETLHIMIQLLTHVVLQIVQHNQ
jgi:hypothetical protein